jgi:hypothetical protein
VFLHLARKENGSVFKLLALIDGPWLAEMVAALLPYVLFTASVSVSGMDNANIKAVRWPLAGAARPPGLVKAG